MTLKLEISYTGWDFSLSFTSTDVRPVPTFACWGKKANEHPPSRAYGFPLASSISICTRRGSAWGTSQLAELNLLQMADPLSALRMRQIHADGRIYHEVDILRRGVHGSPGYLED